MRVQDEIGRRALRLPRLPFPLAAAVLATAAFALALLVGWATAGTHEPLRRVEAEKSSRAPARIPLLAAAPALPAAPAARPARTKKAPSRARRAPAVPPLPHVPTPKLIVGSG
jgi:hypothetical protein